MEEVEVESYRIPLFLVGGELDIFNILLLPGNIEKGEHETDWLSPSVESFEVMKHTRFAFHW